MDRRGRRCAAVPAMTLLGLAHALLPLAADAKGLAAAAMLMGLGDGLSAGANPPVTRIERTAPAQ
ncbi:hypothetical protein AB0F81_08825 [Actinoplanes sp. NPDC024001]|uniref:hypothetical protein n=1 Tax=Actinoplanes sp. NPDC024001 TaxID=3154598 RepID=UPI003400ABD6